MTPTLPFQLNGKNNCAEFSTLKDLVDFIHREIDQKTSITNTRIKFTADVVKAEKRQNGHVYITVSQETEENKKIELTVVVWKNFVQPMERTLAGFGLRSWQGLVNRKWEFQGTLHFYPDRVQFSFWADSIAPQGESDILKRRKLITEQLRREGLLMEVQHSLDELGPIGLIAIITSKSAQGYHDFLSNLLVPENYQPIVHLYESTMQGVNTAQDVINALDRIEAFCDTYQIKYDVIVIIRGGGGPSDLMYFDDYELAKRIAIMNEKIPVLTGIGHEKDYTIPDFVAWKRFPTPTAVAKEISNQIKNYLESLSRKHFEIKGLFERNFVSIQSYLENDEGKTIYSSLSRRLHELDASVVDLAKNLRKTFSLKSLESAFDTNFVARLSKSIENKISSLVRAQLEEFNYFRSQMDGRLQSTEMKILDLDGLKISLERAVLNLSEWLESKTGEFSQIGGPLSALIHGGALVLKNGELVRSIKEIREGEELRVHLIDGAMTTRVETILKNEVDARSRR
ncbi:exodeoxyribonuclease VII large subunit [Fervidobacterium thailandense]|uniref:exodeoxyribonuclease VII large subunit n=1 Tax=Fervidobacterium thailandense TaxID=1008305 RepID=UPI0008461434|nr:exodeoxyribonuclease VII large subunit [Fervidobacterium thailandense]